MSTFLGELLGALTQTLFHPRAVRWDDVAFHMKRTGVDGLPILGLIAFLLGLILATISDQVLAMQLTAIIGKTRELTRELQGTSQNLRQSSETLEMFLQRVYDRPSDLLFGKPPKKRWNE
jgi:hypothetical protein